MRSGGREERLAVMVAEAARNRAQEVETSTNEWRVRGLLVSGKARASEMGQEERTRAGSLDGLVTSAEISGASAGSG